MIPGHIVPPWTLGTAGALRSAETVRVLRSSSPLAGDLVGDRPDLLLETPRRPSEDQHVAPEREDEREHHQRCDGAEGDPHDEPAGHLWRCYTRPRSRAMDSVAAVREEIPDVGVVLEEVMELDQVVRRQSRSRGLTGLRDLLALLIEELGGERCIHVRAADVHTGRDEQRHDLPIRALLNIVL